MANNFPVVFMDIDGVLNTSKNYYEWDRAMRASGRKISFINAPDDEYVGLLFDKELVQNFNLITQHTGAAVVVSSTWRNLYHDFDDLVSVLRRVGIEGEILDRTPNHGRFNGRGERGDECLAWRDDNDHTGPFVCVDDDGDFRSCLENLVQTDGRDGLTESDAFEAVKILKKGRR